MDRFPAHLDYVRYERGVVVDTRMGQRADGATAVVRQTLMGLQDGWRTLAQPSNERPRAKWVSKTMILVCSPHGWTVTYRRDDGTWASLARRAPTPACPSP